MAGKGKDKDITMAGIGPFYTDAEKFAKRRNRMWYQEHIMTLLQNNKENQVRGVTGALVLAKILLETLNEKRPCPAVVPPHNVIPSEDDTLMGPIEPEVLDILYKSTEKGATERYLKERYKKAPDDKFFFRQCGSWDYGWQQKQSRLLARDVNKGRCAILRETFYRKNNLGPDPTHYGQPSGGQVSICSEYSCNFSSPILGPFGFR